MNVSSPLRIGITCYPSVGGSGILASALGEELARRGHEVHFVSHERPFRLPPDAPNTYFHAVPLLQQGPFRYPDYTLPLAVQLAEVSQERRLDVIHAHYAVPHATAAVLAAEMVPPDHRPKVITTLHGTDTTLLAHEPGYRAVIRHALLASDGVTAVSEFLRRETHRILELDRPIEMIHNFFDPRTTTRTREEVRRELGIKDEKLIVHVSNLRPVKRIGLLLKTFARLQPADDFRLLILAGADFAPYRTLVRELGMSGRVLVRENVVSVENYLQAADVGLFTSASESFCLSILEAMAVGCPSVACAVGGIPEVVESGVTGVLVDTADPDALATEVRSLLHDHQRREKMGRLAAGRAQQHFCAARIVPQYEAFYRRLCAGGERAFAAGR